MARALNVMNNELSQTLVTGADGMIGSYVDFGIRTTRDEFDVCDSETIWSAIEKYQPKIILHLAAETDLARCERDPAHAYMVNSVGTYHIARAARAAGTRLVYVSTSSVFDGEKGDAYTEEDIPNPISVYGHSKYLGELAVSSLLENALIARITWVFGGGEERDKKFVGKIMKRCGDETIQAVSDKCASPTYAKDIVNQLKLLLQTDANGIYHIANSGSATRADVAREIVAITGSRASVEDVPESFFGSPYPMGDNETLSSVCMPDMRSWQDALRDYIQTEWPNVRTE